MPDVIPKRHAAFYLDKSLEAWKQQAARRFETSHKRTYWDQTPLQVRADAGLAGEKPVVLTGHQPILFHPGLWVKCIAASLLADGIGGAAAHKLTDTALPSEHPHFLPILDGQGKAVQKRMEFYDRASFKEQEASSPYIALSAPDPKVLNEIFLELKEQGIPTVRKNFLPYEKPLREAFGRAKSWNESHLGTLRFLDGLCETQRFYWTGSELWKMPSFRRFLAHWLGDLGRIQEHYNQALQDHRRLHGIKHELAPSPNLKSDGGWAETPFWISTGSDRNTLWVQKDGPLYKLKGQGGVEVHPLALKDLEDRDWKQPFWIWPKALPQTLFCRFYLCDFFIHGAGGSDYEGVNDLFWKRLFNEEPPSFGVATGTYYVEPEEADGLAYLLEREERMRWWKRVASQNPEYLFSRREAWIQELPAFIHEKIQGCCGNEVLKDLAAEKERLLSQLKDPASKSQAGRRIKEVNQALSGGLSPVIQALDQGLTQVERSKATEETLMFREYPFFCYPVEVFKEMKGRMGSSRAG